MKPKVVRLDTLINPTSRQWEFFRALGQYTYILYGGAGGGGKSYVLRWACVALLLKWAGEGHKGVRVGLFSVDYPTLNDRQLCKIRAEFPEWLGTFHEQRREFVLAPAYGSGVIAFRNLDDPSKYKSAEFAAIAVDELTENDESTFDDLRFRMRWPGIEDTKFIAATNPTGIGHLWVKKLWINGEFPENLKPFAHQFKYVQALATDNPHNPKNYMEKLDSLPQDMRSALRDGSWDVFAGQVFKEWNRDIHTCQAFEIPSWWSKWQGNDPGYTDPATWYWFAADQMGTVYIYREATLQEVTPSKQAKRVAELEQGEQIGFRVTGMDAFVTHPETAKAPVDYYREGGLYGFNKPDHGPGARERMAKVYHEYLQIIPGLDGKPTSKLKIFRPGVINGKEYGCPRLIETLPALVADENKREQVAECAIDHWYQGSGYGLQAWHANNSTAPKDGYKPNQLGAILDHASVTNPVDEDEEY